jgi:hypothetical protein
MACGLFLVVAQTSSTLSGKMSARFGTTSLITDLRQRRGHSLENKRLATIRLIIFIFTVNTVIGFTQLDKPYVAQTV